ncbi:hypothetical protein [Nitrosopumilus sp.]|uniref:hypothetical protein n=1 Tax=Nitrosopumilus sp. TaxID=2024843 RepID=UPI00260A0459|nr:hypothetical protein [Nitrosopumilus sp.]
MKRELTETQHTIKEAEYFLNKIKELERYGDDDEFDYNFHAFLHSWVSIFDVILEDYQRAFGLKISIIDNLSIETFREKTNGDNRSLEFISEYDKQMIEFFGHQNHKKILELLMSPMRFDEYIVFLLNQKDWNNLEYGFHDCYIALYNVIQDILRWDLDYHQLILSPVILQRQKFGFDLKFIQNILSENNFEGGSMYLEEIFEQSFLQQQVIVKQQKRYVGTKSIEELSEVVKNIRIKTPIYTIAGLMKKKRNSRTHRKGKESMMTIQHFEGEELTDKSRNLSFLRENYVNEAQGMIFGHFNTPIGTIDTCEQMLEKAKKFVNDFSQEFPPDKC